MKGAQISQIEKKEKAINKFQSQIIKTIMRRAEDLHEDGVVNKMLMQTQAYRDLERVTEKLKEEVKQEDSVMTSRE